jgi:hypothetical protein
MAQAKSTGYSSLKPGSHVGWIMWTKMIDVTWCDNGKGLRSHCSAKVEACNVCNILDPHSCCVYHWNIANPAPSPKIQVSTSLGSAGLQNTLKKNINRFTQHDFWRCSNCKWTIQFVEKTVVKSLVETLPLGRRLPMKIKGFYILISKFYSYSIVCI